jgi:hypothetical protein
VGLVYSSRGHKHAARRYARDGVARWLYLRDLWMLRALILLGVGGIAKALVLIALSRWYPRYLDPILATLGWPVFFAYLIDTLDTIIVTTVAPIWLVARYRAQQRPRPTGIPDKGV